MFFSPQVSRECFPLTGNISTGCHVGTPCSRDNVYFKWYNIPADGKLVWNIPWTYQTSGMSKPRVFNTLIHNCRNIGNKRSTMSKNGITVERSIP
jgi:hypothetical protein